MADDWITPTLMFNGQAEEAIGFYTGLFDDSGIDSIERYGPDYPGPVGKVVHARLRIKGAPFIAMDNHLEQSIPFTPAISFFVSCADEPEIDRLFAALSDDGDVLMELDRYPFARKYAWVQDRFGVSWQLILTQR